MLRGYGASTPSDAARAGKEAAADESKETDEFAALASMRERAKYMPLRLSYDDRKMLRLAEGALTVSNYTDKVDCAALADPAKAAKRRQRMVAEICGLLSGLVVACNFDSGAALLTERDFASYRSFFRQLFETVRRYKIMNPEKLRSSYGKMLYLLQDANSDEVKELLGFSVVSPVKTVHTLLSKAGALAMLDDPALEPACMEILPDGLARWEIDALIKRKEKCRRHLVRKYADRAAERAGGKVLSEEDVLLCCYSINDNNSFLNSDRRPCDDLLGLLDECFAPDHGPEQQPEPGLDLGIVAGSAGGARLTHSHAKQWAFARQSLTLWRAITNDMFRLWFLSEADLLSPDAPYTLKDTGQGLQRVQPCPRTYRAMQQLLRQVQSQASSPSSLSSSCAWVGSSMIHMGDHNVPNALSFLDKYTQVARILNPLTATLRSLKALSQDDPGIRQLLMDGFGGVEGVQRHVLGDFFRGAFDGSGADNFYDAGSCIDGRLTSAWNWCNQLPSKPYFFVFKLAGFSGFDGQFDA